MFSGIFSSLTHAVLTLDMSHVDAISAAIPVAITCVEWTRQLRVRRSMRTIVMFNPAKKSISNLKSVSDRLEYAQHLQRGLLVACADYNQNARRFEQPHVSNIGSESIILAESDVETAVVDP